MIDEPDFAQAKAQVEPQTEPQTEPSKKQEGPEKGVDVTERDTSTPLNSKGSTDDTKRESYQRFTDDNSLFLSLDNPRDCGKVLQYLGEDGQFLNTKLKQPGKILSQEALEDAGETGGEKEKDLSFLEWLLQFFLALFGGGGKGASKETIPERAPAMEFVLDSTQMRAIDSGQDVEIALANGATVYLNKGIMVDKAKSMGEGMYKARFGAVCIKEEGSNKFNVLDIASLGREFRDPEKGALLKNMMEKQARDAREAAEAAAATALADPTPETGMAAALAASKAAMATGDTKSLTLNMNGDPKKWAGVRGTLHPSLAPPMEHEVQVRMTQKEYLSIGKEAVPFVVVRDGRNNIYLLTSDDIEIATGTSDEYIATLKSVRDTEGNVMAGAVLRRLNLDGAVFHGLMQPAEDTVSFFLHEKYINELKEKGETVYTRLNGGKSILKETDILEIEKKDEYGHRVTIKGYTFRDAEGNEQYRPNEEPHFPNPSDVGFVEKVNALADKKMEAGREALALRQYIRGINACPDLLDKKIHDYIRAAENHSDLTGDVFKHELAEMAVTPIISVKDKDGTTQKFYAEKNPVEGLLYTDDLRSLSTLSTMIAAGEVSSDKTTIAYRYTPIQRVSPENDRQVWENIIARDPNLDNIETKAFYLPELENIQKAFPEIKLPEKTPELEQSIKGNTDIEFTLSIMRRPPPIDIRSNPSLRNTKEMLQILTATPEEVYDRQSANYNLEKSVNAFERVSNILGLPPENVQHILDDARLTIAKVTDAENGIYSPVSLNNMNDNIGNQTGEQYAVVPADAAYPSHILKITPEDIHDKQVELQRKLENIPKMTESISPDAKNSFAEKYLREIAPQNVPDAADRLILHQHLLNGCLSGILPVPSEKPVPTEKELVTAMHTYATLYENRPETTSELIAKAVAKDTFEARLMQTQQQGMEQARRVEVEQSQGAAPRARF